jgi:hypothetical protein
VSDDVEVGDQAWVKTILNRLPFVEWDRWYPLGNGAVKVFGWIDREDQYKDFVLLRLVPEEQVIEYSTSSAAYAETIADRLPGDLGHVECRRVENHFDVDHAVELEDGGEDSERSEGLQPAAFDSGHAVPDWTDHGDYNISEGAALFAGDDLLQRIDEIEESFHNGENAVRGALAGRADLVTYVLDELREDLQEVTHCD